ncbi:MAG: hypothetical protein HDR75_03160 [Bacteroides sp.]|nr:hypothetical protein [Bacteroides sp.]MBD5372331.1 hypothetical protein [Bacteroides sp.]
MKIKNILNAGMIAVCAAAVAAPLSGCSKSNTTTEQTPEPAEATADVATELFTPANLEEGKTYPLIVVSGNGAAGAAAVFTGDEVQKETPAYVYTGSDVKSVIEANAVDAKRVYSVGDTPDSDVYAASLIVNGQIPSQLKGRNYIFFYTTEEPVGKLTDALREANVGYTTAEIPADQQSVEKENELTGVMLEKGQSVNIFQFATGSVSDDAAAATAAAIPAVRAWILAK